MDLNPLFFLWGGAGGWGAQFYIAANLTEVLEMTQKGKKAFFKSSITKLNLLEYIFNADVD